MAAEREMALVKEWIGQYLCGPGWRSQRMGEIGDQLTADEAERAGQPQVRDEWTPKPSASKPIESRVSEWWKYRCRDCGAAFGTEGDVLQAVEGNYGRCRNCLPPVAAYEAGMEAMGFKRCEPSAEDHKSLKARIRKIAHAYGFDTGERRFGRALHGIVGHVLAERRAAVEEAVAEAICREGQTRQAELQARDETHAAEIARLLKCLVDVACRLNNIDIAGLNREIARLDGEKGESDEG